MAEVKIGTIEGCKPGTMAQVVVNDKTLLLVNVNGQFYCCENSCTHRGGSLNEGELQGVVVTCPWHSAQFDVTSGKVLAQPAERDLKNYKVIVKGNDLFIEL